MKKAALMVAVAFTAFLFSFKTVEPTTWTVDKVHSKLTFSITHMMVSDVEGAFKIFDAKITATKEDFSDASIDFTADASSLNTENDQRDGHVKSPAFLDIAKYPTITFKSTSFKKVSGNNYKITGNLTLHGVTKAITLDALVRTGVNPMSKKEVAGVKITGTIKRGDFGIGASFPGAVLSDEVAIAANGEFGKN